MTTTERRPAVRFHVCQRAACRDKTYRLNPEGPYFSVIYCPSCVKHYRDLGRKIAPTESEERLGRAALECRMSPIVRRGETAS